jgi:predicted RecB family endonuclease
MAAGKSVTNLAQVAAEAIAEKLGVDIVAIDMTEQMVLSGLFDCNRVKRSSGGCNCRWCI